MHQTAFSEESISRPLKLHGLHHLTANFPTLPHLPRHLETAVGIFSDVLGPSMTRTLRSPLEHLLASGQGANGALSIRRAASTKVFMLNCAG